MRQLAILALASMLLCSCSATKYVPVETVRTEKEEVTRWRTDTVTQGDTRLIYIKGDTVIDRRERWRERVREVRDTVYVERTDSPSRSPTLLRRNCRGGNAQRSTGADGRWVRLGW